MGKRNSIRSVSIQAVCVFLQIVLFRFSPTIVAQHSFEERNILHYDLPQQNHHRHHKWCNHYELPTSELIPTDRLSINYVPIENVHDGDGQNRPTTGRDDRIDNHHQNQIRFTLPEQYSLPIIDDRISKPIRQQVIVGPTHLIYPRVSLVDQSHSSLNHNQWDDDHSIFVEKPKKFRKRLKKRPFVGDQAIKEIIYADHYKPKHSTVNKIIVIEESDPILSHPDRGQNDRQWEQIHNPNPLISTKMPVLDDNHQQLFYENHFHSHHHLVPEDPYRNDYHLSRPLVNDKPILTIKQLHDQLNQSDPTILFGGVLPKDDRKNFTIQSSNGHSTMEKFGSQDFFVKSNNFSFQKDWNLESISSTTIEPRLMINESKRNQNRSKEQLVLSGSVNRHWLTSTTPTVFYFTSQRNTIYTSPLTLSPTPMPTIRTTTSMAIQTNGIKKSNQNYFDSRKGEYSMAKRKNSSENNQSLQSNGMNKISSFIMAFCLSLLLLCGS